MIDYISLNTNVDILYTKLKSLCQEEFPPEYQLIVNYTEDIIGNTEYPGQRLTDLVRILSELDIPTFFVTIKTNHQHINRDLTQLDTIYKNGCAGVIEIGGVFNSIKEDKDVFCVLPWMHFYFNPQGQINPCCDSDMNYPLGNYKNVIDFNSTSIVKFRNSILNNQPVPQCTGCYNTEKQGLPSLRQDFNKRFSAYKPANPLAQVDDFKLRYVDVRLNNICNLKCRMCSGKFSSRIAEEDYQIWGDTKFLHNSNNNSNEDKILELITNQIDNIEHIYFAGGEPLVNQSHYKILDLLLAHNKNNINVQYNTNFSLLTFKKYNVLNYWQQFTNVTVGASIDLIGPASDYVRNGVSYQTLEDNYYTLVEECPHVKFNITSVLSLYNVFNLCDLQTHWINNIGVGISSIQFTVLTTPDFLSIQVLPGKFKQQATNYIEKHILYLSSVGATALVLQWANVIKYMNSKDDSYLLDKFFELGDIRDRYRKQQFELIFPEFRDLRQHLMLQ